MRVLIEDDFIFIPQYPAKEWLEGHIKEAMHTGEWSAKAAEDLPQIKYAYAILEEIQSALKAFAQHCYLRSKPNFGDRLKSLAKDVGPLIQRANEIAGRVEVYTPAAKKEEGAPPAPKKRKASQPKKKKVAPMETLVEVIEADLGLAEETRPN